MPRASSKKILRDRAAASIAAIDDDEEVRIAAGIAQDPDNPELSDEQIAAMRRTDEVAPDIAAAWRRSQVPPKAATRRAVTVPIDPDILDHFRATSHDWRSRINDVLRQAVERERRRNRA